MAFRGAWLRYSVLEKMAGWTSPPASSNKPTRPADESESIDRPSGIQTLAVDNGRRGADKRRSGGGGMKFIEPHPFADPDAAARKLIEIANSVEAVQDGRIYIERVNEPFLRLA